MAKRLIAALILILTAVGTTPAAFALGMNVLKAEPPKLRPENHSCCPRFHAQFLLPAVVSPGAPPTSCENRPCCAKSAPENSSALPATNQTQAESQSGSATGAVSLDRGTDIAAPYSANFALSYFARRAVLRI